MDFTGNVCIDSWFHFVGDLGHRLDIQEFFKGCFIIVCINNIGGVGPWQIYALSEYSCFYTKISSEIVLSEHVWLHCCSGIFVQDPAEMNYF